MVACWRKIGCWLSHYSSAGGERNSVDSVFFMLFPSKLILLRSVSTKSKTSYVLRHFFCWLLMKLNHKFQLNLVSINSQSPRWADYAKTGLLKVVVNMYFHVLVKEMNIFILKAHSHCNGNDKLNKIFFAFHWRHSVNTTTCCHDTHFFPLPLSSELGAEPIPWQKWKTENFD